MHMPPAAAIPGPRDTRVRRIAAGLLLLASMFTAPTSAAHATTTHDWRTPVALGDPNIVSMAKVVEGDYAAGIILDPSGTAHATVWRLSDPGAAPTMLAEPEGASDSDVSGIAGNLIIGSYMLSGHEYAAVWTMETPTAQPMAIAHGGFVSLKLRSISGTRIVGAVGTGYDPNQPAVWDATDLTQPPTILPLCGSGNEGFASGVSGGNVVGISRYRDSEDNTTDTPVIWDLTAATITCRALPLSDAGHIAPYALAMRGNRVVGNEQDPSTYAWVPVFWDLTGTTPASPLATRAFMLDTYRGTESGDVRAVSGTLAVGITSGLQNNAAIWDLTHPSWEPLLLDRLSTDVPYASANANAIDGPHVVGYETRPDETYQYKPHALFWDLSGIHRVSVGFGGPGYGSVTATDPQLVDCAVSEQGSAGTCVGAHADSITVTAVAAAGSTFTGWTGCTSTVGETCTVDLRTEDAEITARFGVEPPSTGTMTCTVTGYDVVYDGAEHNAGASCVGSDGTTPVPVVVTGTAHTNVGSWTETATVTDPTATYPVVELEVSDAITKAPSSTVVSCPETVTYSGSPLTPCTVAVTGAGGLQLDPTPDYESNTTSGTAHARHTFIGDGNHETSTARAAFRIVPVDVAVQYTGSTVAIAAGTPLRASVQLQGTIAPAVAGCPVQFVVNSSTTTETYTATTTAAGIATVSPSPVFGPDAYAVTVSVAGNCSGTADATGAFVVGVAGDAAYGGGWYTAGGRTNLAFAVHPKSKTTPTVFRGSLVWGFKGAWRFKGTLVTYAKLSVNGVATGRAAGTGDLFWWDRSMNAGLGGWALAGSGVAVTIQFQATGSGGKTSAPGSFGIALAFTPIAGQPALPSSALSALKGGAIKLS